MSYLDRKQITEFGERELYFDYVFGLDDAYCAFHEHRAGIESKKAKGEKVSEADVKFEFVKDEGYQGPGFDSEVA